MEPIQPSSAPPGGLLPITTTSLPGIEPDRTAANGQTLLHELMGISSETVRDSISSFTSHRERRSRKDTTNLAVTKTVNDELEEPKRVKKTLHFLTLPPEVQLLVMQHLDFADIERLRRTCKQIRALATPRQIRSLLGPMQLQTQLLGHCKSCLTYDQTRSSLLLSTPTDPGYPLASRCISCAMASHDPVLRVGKKVHLANFEAVWVCRWCGWPVECSAIGNDQFHPSCYKAYNKALFFFFLLGWLQLSLGIVAGALAWRYFRHVTLVLAPTLTSFFLLWICLGFIILRNNKRRTYHWTLFFELAILGLWIPPVYHIASEFTQLQGEPVPKSTAASLAIFALNMIFRVLNALGNVVLLCGYNMTRRHWPNPSRWRKLFHPILSGLLFWTYPQAVDHKYPTSAV